MMTQLPQQKYAFALRQDETPHNPQQFRTNVPQHRPQQPQFPQQPQQAHQPHPVQQQ